MRRCFPPAEPERLLSRYQSERQRCRVEPVSLPVADKVFESNASFLEETHWRRFTGVLGILAVLLAAWLGSTDRRHIRWRTVAWGLGLQIDLRISGAALRLRAARDDLGGRRGEQHAGAAHSRGHEGAVWRAGHAQHFAAARSSRSRCCRRSSSSRHSSRCFITSA